MAADRARLVAAALMIGGAAVLGVATGLIASWLVGAAGGHHRGSRFGGRWRSVH